MRKNYIKDRLLTLLSKKPFRFLLVYIDKYYRSKGFLYKKVRYNLNIRNEKLVVIYRISSNNNSKSPIFTDNKYKLVKFCLDSFYKSFNKVKPKVIFLLDSCPVKFEKLVKSYSLKSEVVKLDNAGNKGSFFTQIDMALDLSDDKFVYFAEDDYYYLGNCGELLINSLENFDFVTLCEHANYYEDPWIKTNRKIVFLANHHWTTRKSTCLTFGARVKAIKKYQNYFKKYGPLAHPIWSDIYDKKGKLWGAIPTLCTHLVKNQLAPGVNWKEKWKNIYLILVFPNIIREIEKCFFELY